MTRDMYERILLMLTHAYQWWVMIVVADSASYADGERKGLLADRYRFIIDHVPISEEIAGTVAVVLFLAAVVWMFAFPVLYSLYSDDDWATKALSLVSLKYPPVGVWLLCNEFETDRDPKVYAGLSFLVFLAMFLSGAGGYMVI